MLVVGVLLMDHIILPSYVGYNNEHYLPDIRGQFVEKGNYHLRSLGFQTEIAWAPYSEYYKPGTVIKMFPRAFTKVKEGRAINLTIAGKMEDITIPSLINTSLRNASLEISRKTFQVGTYSFIR